MRRSTLWVGSASLASWRSLGLMIGMLVAAVGGRPPSAAAADLYWAGTGTWNTSDQIWGTASGGPYDAATWNNTTPDAAVFEGTAGTVTLGQAITAAGLTFNTTDYTVTGNTLTLSGTPSISTGTDISATIASRIAGSAGLTKDGDGTLNLSAANVYTGGTTINAGTIQG